MNSKLINILTYTAGWFWAVFLGSWGYSLIAFLGILLMIATSLYFEKKHHPKKYVQDLILMLAALVPGLILELIFISTGVLSYPEGIGIFPPLWIIALYPLFALLINHSLNFLKTYKSLPFVLGFFGAPFSYMAGERMGGVSFGFELPITFVLVGVGWAINLWILVELSKSIHQAAEKTFRDEKGEKISLLYDGDCPLCDREICYLKKQKGQKRVNFIDISDTDYNPGENGGVDYETAMKEMHAVTGKGEILTGIDAFSQVYARVNLPVLATLMHIPGVKSVLTPLYRLFAKYRLKITGKKPRDLQK